MTVRTYGVQGPFCGVCLAALLDQLRALDEVREVAADLGVGGATSVVVTSGAGVRVERVREAVERAGFVLVYDYQLAPPHRGSEHLLAARASTHAREDETRKEGVRR